MAADLWFYWGIRGRYRIGRRRLEAFLALSPAPTATRAMALWAFGVLAQATGDLGAALAGFGEARRVSEQTGGDRELAYALLGLALLRLGPGEAELAGELLAAPLETMTRVGDAFGRALGLYSYATAMAAEGRLADARRLALDGLDTSDRAGDKYGWGNLNALLGIVEWLSGNPQSAEARLKEAVRVLDRIGHRWGIATSLEGLAWAARSSGRPDRAALLLGASAAIWRELGNTLPYWQAEDDRCQAAARAALGEGRYRACWEEGHALSQDQAVAAALEDQGTVPAARPATAVTAAKDAFELSARELEVARLVADGLSNPAIASALFVSVATVKTHVSHILAKLGLDSRTQLARWIAGHDLGPPTPVRE
jgi:non-specific serine/threonine protein kinase